MMKNEIKRRKMRTTTNLKETIMEEQRIKKPLETILINDAPMLDLRNLPAAKPNTEQQKLV